MNAQLEQAPQMKKTKKSPYFWTFVVSIVLTIIAFVVVLNDVIPLTVAMAIILVLAVIQAMFQAYVWMHLNQKGHGWPILLISAGFFFSVLFVVALKLM